MIRRTKAGDNVASPAPTAGGKAGVRTPHAPGAPPRRPHDSKLSTPLLFTMICAALFGCILVLSILSPSSVQQAENSLYKAEQIVESEVSGLFGGGTHERAVPPVVQEEHQRRERSVDATDAMLQQDSSWVDGEKKLKQKLKLRKSIFSLL